MPSVLPGPDKQAGDQREEGGSAPEKNAVVPHVPSPARLPGITQRNNQTGAWPLLPRLDVYWGDELAAQPLPIGTRVKSTGEVAGSLGTLPLCPPAVWNGQDVWRPLGQVDTGRWLGCC